MVNSHGSFCFPKARGGNEVPGGLGGEADGPFCELNANIVKIINNEKDFTGGVWN